MFLRKQGLWIWAAVLWTLIQLPYLPGPFRIDDPYHLEAAKQMRRAPGDPYGFQINWDGTPRPAFVTYASPPLVPAWLALWSCVFPNNEISLHLAMLPFSLVALIAFGVLARSFEVRPSMAMALLACSPAFFLSSQVLMPDMPMLCLFLLAVAGARFYQLKRNWSAALVACVAGICCPLAKYNGAVLAPVLLGISLVGWREAPAANNRGPDRSANCCGCFSPGMLAIISAPILSLVCWGAFTWAKYGAVHFMNMSTFQRGQTHSLDPATLTAGILGALGLGVVPLGLLGFLSTTERPAWWLKVLGLCIGFGAAWLAVSLRYSLGSVLLFGFSVSVSVYILSLTVWLAWPSARTRDRALMPLLVWILAGLAFQYGLMFSAVRYLLFLAPPVILLTLRLSSWVPREGQLTPILLANLLFVAALGFADFRQASVYPSVVEQEIRPRLEKSRGRLFFDGHWGFQYYASQIGGEPFDELRPPRLRAGDLVVVAKTAWPKLNRAPNAPGLDVTTTTLSVPGSGFLRTLSCGAGANFYASVMPDCERPTWLPFGFSREVAETFVFYSVRKPAALERPVLEVSGSDGSPF
jgi:Dolichyl-phosphate-mannose-protein mannosyltransferase